MKTKKRSATKSAAVKKGLRTRRLNNIGARLETKLDKKLDDLRKSAARVKRKAARLHRLTQQVAESCWYAHVPKLPPIPLAISDARGFLQVLTSEERIGHAIGSVVVLYTEAAPVGEAPYERANHWHKEDSHLTVLLTGAMEYFERQPDGTITRLLVEAQTDHSAVFTPPRVEHCMRFSSGQDTMAIVIADRERTQADYEADLVRVPSLATEYFKIHGTKNMPTIEANFDDVCIICNGEGKILEDHDGRSGYGTCATCAGTGRKDRNVG